MKKKNKWMIGLTAVLMLMQSMPMVFADGNYTIPGQIDSPTEEVTAPEQTEPPKETDVPKQTEPPAEETAVPEKTEKPEFVIPGSSETSKPDATEKPEDMPQPDVTEKPEDIPKPDDTAEPDETSAPEQNTDPSLLSDQEFMDHITMAFMDGVEEINPDNPHVKIQAVLVRVPEERLGSAQWFVNGEARADYYSSEFPIYNGKTTAIQISVPFEKGMADTEMTVALEVHLNGVVRRIEKRIVVNNYDDSWYEQKEAERVLSMVKPVEIEATVLNWTYTYSDKWLGTTNGGLNAGDQVIYMDHNGLTSAYIWIPGEARACWVPYYSIRISSKNYTVYEDFSDTDKEIFVNAKGYESQSEYLIWINLERQKVNVFLGAKGRWDLIRVSTCSSGANTTPTPTGVVTYCAYSNGWFNPTYYVKPVLYINLERAIAMHSILFNPNGTVQDGTQGTPASHGCVRMPPAEIDWIASHVPVGTTVVVF